MNAAAPLRRLTGRKPLRAIAVEGGAGATLDGEPEKGSGSSNVIVQVLAGLTTTLSMIPESLAFTFVAGVPPVVGLHAAATMAFVTAIFGSQHGVISGAAGATAVVLAPLCATFGIEYLFAAVVLSAIIQVRSEPSLSLSLHLQQPYLN